MEREAVVSFLGRQHIPFQFRSSSHGQRERRLNPIGKIVATTRPGNHPNRWKEATQMRVVASPMPAARPQLDADLARAVLASESCKVAVMQHRSVTTRVDRAQLDGRDGMGTAVVDCGDADLLIK